MDKGLCVTRNARLLMLSMQFDIILQQLKTSFPPMITTSIIIMLHLWGKKRAWTKFMHYFSFTCSQIPPQSQVKAVHPIPSGEATSGIPCATCHNQLFLRAGGRGLWAPFLKKMSPHSGYCESTAMYVVLFVELQAIHVIWVSPSSMFPFQLHVMKCMHFYSLCHFDVHYTRLLITFFLRNP